jgi:AcrR family transcriptional regulator
MRTHGWGGATPADDQEAVDRILDAAGEAIDQRGANFRVADVARALNVSRQTVYNYFPGGNALLVATATRAGLRLIDRISEHLRGISDPVDALVEGMAFTLEQLPEDKHVQLLITTDMSTATTAFTSDPSIQFAHEMFAGLDVDWDGVGMDDAGLDGLAEYMLRIMQSLTIDPGRPPRTGATLRSYLRRWVAPVLKAEIRAGR